MKKLNLGSGKCPLSGYVNVDIRKVEGVDIAANVQDLSMFKNGECEEIFARDVLEHMPRREWRNVLDEWLRVLSPGGVLKIRFPDSILLFEAYQKGAYTLDRLFQLVFGDQNVPENAHLSGLTREMVISYLKEKGMTILKDWKDGHADIRITASKGKPITSLEHPI